MVEPSLETIPKFTPFWGPATASVEWCEKNYDVSPYVAEFWNTFSNLSIICAGLLGYYLKKRHSIDLEWRFALLDLSLFIVGLGSTAFHGTMLLSTQIADELPMIWGMLIWCFVLYDMRNYQIEFSKSNPGSKNSFNNILGISLGAFGLVWTINSRWIHAHYPLVFQWTFVALTALALFGLVNEFRTCKDQQARWLFIMYISGLLAGTSLWLTENRFCEEIRYTVGEAAWYPYIGSLHGYWHIFMGISCYCGSMFVFYIRSELHGQRPIVRWLFGIIPYIQLRIKM